MNNAHLYATANAMQKKDTDEILREIMQEIDFSNEKEFVLDIGSGPGDVTVNILKKYLPNNTHIVGSDISGEMVEFANSQYKSEKIEFQILDIESSNVCEMWTKNKFSKIFSFYCFHWVQNQRQAVDNLFKLLKPGGEIFLLFLSHCPIFTVYETISKEHPWDAYMKDVDRFISPYHNSKNPAEEFRKILLMGNFKEIQVCHRDTSFKFPSSEALFKSIAAVNPFNERIPPRLQSEYDQFMKRIIKDLCEEKENGEVEVKYSLIFVRAKKIISKCI